MHAERCTATSKQTGQRCRAWPPPGSTVCRWHGGAAPQVVAAAVRRLQAAEARADLERLGVAIETTPLEALEALLWEAAGNVAVLRAMVHELPRAELYGPKFAPGVIHRAQGDAGVIPVAETAPRELTAIPHVLVVMYDAERDRLAAIARACAALGLDERRVRLAEAAADRLFAAVGRALDRAGLDADQAQAVRLSLANELRAA